MNSDRTALLALAILCSPSHDSFAQSSKQGPSATWTNTIEVDKGEITNGKRKFEAHVITVFEADASTAIDLWEKDVASSTKDISGKRPYRANGARIPAISEAPIIILATSGTDKKSGNATLTLAYLQNDSTVLADNGSQQKVSRELAVRLNQALVQTQIDAVQKELDDAVDDHVDKSEDQARSEKRMSDANADLEKNAKKQAKLQRDIADSQADIAGLEKRFALRNDPKDLQKLTSTRKKLAGQEKKLASLMSEVSKHESKANKHQQDMSSHSEKREEHAKSKEELQQRIAELKRKKDAIK